MKNKNQPANPHTVVVKSDGVSGSPIETIEYLGLTKREYFAAKIASGLVHNVIWNDEQDHERFASACVSIADELLKQLENK